VPFTSISYFEALVDAFEALGSDRGFEIMQVLSGQDPLKELHRVTALLKYHVGGIMLVPSARPEQTLEAVVRSGTPLVLVDRPDPAGRFDQVTFDNFGAMHEATTRLIALGHRRILFIVRQRTLSVTVRRIDGLNAAIRQSGQDVALTILEGTYEESSFLARVGPELASARRPTAIIVSNSMLAAWTFRALRAFALSCPGEVSLLAFDEPEWADLVQPALSVIRQPTRAIALTAWELLMRRMRRESEAVQRVELRAEVIFRESVGVPRPRRPRGTRSPAVGQRAP
jgi:LacI family transcriptional regulator